MASSLSALQFELLRELFDLSRAQRASIERDDIDRVLQLMGDREAILSRLADIATAAAEEPENLVRFPGAEDHLRQDALALDTVIRGILEHDRENEVMLAERMDDLRQELPRLAHGRRATSAYRATAPHPSSISRSS